MLAVLVEPGFHYVLLFRLRPGVTLKQVRSVRERLESLVETLPGVMHMAVTDNLSERNAGFTLVLFSVFETRDAFEIFQRHPAWRAVRNELEEEVVEDWIVAQG